LAEDIELSTHRNSLISAWGEFAKTALIPLAGW
jgi:hypothetical protein